MGEQPLVSIIVIFFNAQDFLEEAIRSVLSQTYPAWELLLVDDGSTDESTHIARRYTEQNPGRVRYLEHPGHINHGMSASRNLGIAHSAGALIALLDADDTWTPTKLERQVGILAAHPEAAMVYGPTQWWYSWTSDPQDLLRDYIHELGVPSNAMLQPPALLVQTLRNEGYSPCTCSVLLRRHVIEKVGGFEEQFRGLYEDQVFFSKISLSENIYVDSECSARYRQHPASSYSMHLGTWQYWKARRAYLTWLTGYLEQRGEARDDIWKELRRETRISRFTAVYRLIQRAREWLPGRAVRLVQRLSLRLPALPLFRNLRCLQFRRLSPIGGGKMVGTSIVRAYWEDYLQQHRADIRGHALEVGTTSTILRLGGTAVTRAEAIDLSPHSPEITLVADLSRADQIPSDTFDCFVIQFTMHLIYDVDAAIYHAIRILKPGGILLVNFPCVDYYFPHGLDMGTGEPLFLYHWFTPIQVENLLRSCSLQEGEFYLQIYGNLFARIAYQMNLPAEHLTRWELEYRDLGHPLLICARVVKPAEWRAERPLYRDPWRPEAKPARWNSVLGHYGS